MDGVAEKARRCPGYLGRDGHSARCGGRASMAMHAWLMTPPGCLYPLVFRYLGPLTQDPPGSTACASESSHMQRPMLAPTGVVFQSPSPSPPSSQALRLGQRPRTSLPAAQVLRCPRVRAPACTLTSSRSDINTQARAMQGRYLCVCTWAGLAGRTGRQAGRYGWSSNFPTPLHRPLAIIASAPKTPMGAPLPLHLNPSSLSSPLLS